VISFCCSIYFKHWKTLRYKRLQSYNKPAACFGLFRLFSRRFSGKKTLYNYVIYRVIKKSLCTWWLQQRKLQVMFKVSPDSLQTFIETPNCVLEDHVQYSTVHIQNGFCGGQLQIINLLYCNHQVYRDFLIIVYIQV